MHRPDQGRSEHQAALGLRGSGPPTSHVPDVASGSAQEMLESAKWQYVGWQRSTKGKLSARFAAMRVRVADGPPQRIGHLGQQHLPGEEAWLVGEQRSTGERNTTSSICPPTPRSASLRRQHARTALESGDA